VTDFRDALRRLAQERGQVMGELGVRPDDARWTRAEADAIASLVAPVLRLRLPRMLESLRRRLLRAIR
jgi:hypothetical protein